MQKKRQNQIKGYTLIEILVGLTIIGVLFSLGYATFRDFSRREALSGTSKKIQGDLRLVQSMALSGQKPQFDNSGFPTSLCAPPKLLDGYSFQVYSTTEYKIEAKCGASTVTVKDVVFPSSILISSPSPNPIIFKVLGSGTNIPAGQETVINITQAGTNNVATITITAGGEIK
ncbi:MAG TPA: prepilin-type N-terminal cleavage/methylation domain-containing protein [Patescibacteria group bacterium]|nr:prepilin-type N-terminal cleavage/methylation domain-containing protein [Patescibacteria group bacterium]